MFQKALLLAAMLVCIGYAYAADVPPDPGIRALAAASTDVIVVDVLETSPRKAIEGTRDTVRLKVVRTLLGPTAADDTLGVYYHLLWADPENYVLEPTRFEKGRRYLVFLTAHVEDRGKEGKRVAYEPVDPWLWVQPAHPSLIREVAAQSEFPTGPLRGEWSRTAGGRLPCSRTGCRCTVATVQRHPYH